MAQDLSQFCCQLLLVLTSVICRSQVKQDITKGEVFFLHFLVMTSTLLSFSGFHECCHRLKNFIYSPHLPFDEVSVMDFQKQMIFFLLVFSPMTSMPFLS